MKHYATAVWNGSGKEGSGNLTTQTETLKNVAYDWRSRFADGNLTNPEELIAAAHAGCFSMKLSFVLGAAGFTADAINTKCEITIEDGTITDSHLTVSAKIPGISQEQYDTAVAEAKASCPVSKLLKANITHEAVLV